MLVFIGDFHQSLKYIQFVIQTRGIFKQWGFEEWSITEAAVQRCSLEKVLWKYASNLQENTHAEVRLQ